MFKRKTVTVIFILLSLVSHMFSTDSATTAYLEGCKFYSEGDWESSKIMLKKAVSYEQNFKPDVYYMLITAEMEAGDIKSALDDCNVYLANFKSSSLYPRVKYYKGKILFDLQEYEKSIIELSDFCHQYVDDELYSYALYYIGESLYAGYKYDEARGIFDRVITEFPNSEKAPAAQYRIDTILQHSREEKLLYLLKQTGEEYLSAKEEYEKQLKMANSENIYVTKQRLSEEKNKNDAFEKQIADLQSQLEEAKAETKKMEKERNEAIKKAGEIEKQAKDAVAKATAEAENSANKNNNYVAPSINKKESLDVYDEEKEKTPAVNENEEVVKKGDENADVPALEPYDETLMQIKALKEKAREVQKILDSKKIDSNEEKGSGK